jgi:ParB/RepB/Spo0J family partition protein
MQAGKYQPRTRMDEGALAELAASIKAQGLMQPILVRPIGNEGGKTRYEIIAGERRFRASQLAGMEEVPVLVKDVDDQAAAAMALIENMQREDLNPLEEAQGIHRLITDFNFTHEQAAQSVGRSRSAVSNLLRLMNLAKPVQTMLMAGDIDMGHARSCWRPMRQPRFSWRIRWPSACQYAKREKLVAKTRSKPVHQKAVKNRKNPAISRVWKKRLPICWQRRWY